MSNYTKEEDNQYGAYMITFIAIALYTMIGPIFGGASSFWYLLILLIAGVAGYFGDRSNPIPSIVGCLAVVIIFPIAYAYYFHGRSSFIQIELLIPVFMTVIPALIIHYGVAFLVSLVRK